MKIPEQIKRELAYDEVVSFEVDPERVKVVTVRKDDKDKQIVFFTLKLNGVTINNCTVATTKEDKDFISFPSHADKNGKYRSDVYFVLSDEDTAMIIKEIERILNEE